VTALELRHATIGYSQTAVRAAVEAGLRECPAHDPEAPDFAELVTFWLVDPDCWEWFPPPLPENTTAAIHRWLLAVAH
jgi:RimJ/RimL family protein N-acetyltransferase